jgi:hypothetical protein
MSGMHDVERAAGKAYPEASGPLLGNPTVSLGEG